MGEFLDDIQMTVDATQVDDYNLHVSGQGAFQESYLDVQEDDFQTFFYLFI